MCDKNIKGSIILSNKSEKNILVDGIIPKSLLNKKYSTTSIGFGCVMRPSNIRSGNILSGKIGNLNIKDHREYIEVNKSNISKFEKLKI